jgi:hypothetical protein
MNDSRWSAISTNHERLQGRRKSCSVAADTARLVRHQSTPERRLHDCTPYMSVGKLVIAWSILGGQLLYAESLCGLDFTSSATLKWEFQAAPRHGGIGHI